MIDQAELDLLSVTLGGETGSDDESHDHELYARRRQQVSRVYQDNGIMTGAQLGQNWWRRGGQVPPSLKAVSMFGKDLPQAPSLN